MTLTARVAISKEFMACLARLPKHIEKKVRTFTEKFTANPTSSGLNFERLEGCKDDKVRSVRIDQAYRAIVIHPPKGDVFLCVWVDHHDKAYAWVRNKRFDVNPSSGVLQLYDVQEAPPHTPEAPPVDVPLDVPPSGLFGGHDDEDLMLAGVPLPLLPSVRAIHNEDDLDVLRPHLPEDTADALYGLAAGLSLDEAVEEAARARTVTVDPEDFAAALDNPTSKRTFKVVEDDSELAAMFDRPLEQWRLFLHPSQQRLVEADVSGPMRVLGGAGTGKTVVLMHRARHLARKLDGDRRVLVTTFTRNLARDLKRHLKALCSPEVYARIDVVNLNQWAQKRLKQEVSGIRIVSGPQRRDRMAAAVAEHPDTGLPDSFFMEEWERVVLANEIVDEAAYLRVSRKGRGTRVDRAARSRAWQVFHAYRSDLGRDNLYEWADVLREARMLLQKGSASPYAAVCADESQDFSRSALLLLAALAPAGRNNLLLVGDGHQRIYGQPVTLSSCGIEVRGRAHRLRLNYRTTDAIARQGLAIIKGLRVDDLDGGEDSLKGYTSLRQGTPPEAHLLQDEGTEAEVIVAKIRQWLDAGRRPEDICLASRTSRPLENRYIPLLEEHKIQCAIIEADSDDEDAPGRVRVATMHRLKGLEYPCVLLAGVHDGHVPLDYALTSKDAASKKEALAQERCLLYVACTRARDELVITGYGKASKLLRG